MNLQKKAQMWSMDFTISVMMFFIALVLVLFAWNYVASDNYELRMLDEMETTGLLVSDVLIRTPGTPADWNTTALAIGLASDENIVDETRARNFLFYMDYNESKRIMGIRNYEYYFRMRSLDNATMQLDGFPIEKGYNPSVNVNIIVPVERYVLFRGEIAKLDFILWF
jgi:hypothetical protein